MSDWKDIDDATDGQIHFDESGLSDDVERLRGQLAAAVVSIDNLERLVLSMKRDLEGQQRINHHLKNHLDVLHSFQQELLDGLVQSRPGHPLQDWLRGLAEQLRRMKSDAMREGFLKLDRHRAPERHEEHLRSIEREEHRYHASSLNQPKENPKVVSEKMKVRLRKAFGWKADLK